MKISARSQRLEVVAITSGEAIHSVELDASGLRLVLHSITVERYASFRPAENGRDRGGQGV